MLKMLALCVCGILCFSEGTYGTRKAPADPMSKVINNAEKACAAANELMQSDTGQEELSSLISECRTWCLHDLTRRLCRILVNDDRTKNKWKWPAAIVWGKKIFPREANEDKGEVLRVINVLEDFISNMVAANPEIAADPEADIDPEVACAYELLRMSDGLGLKKRARIGDRRAMSVLYKSAREDDEICRLAPFFGNLDKSRIPGSAFYFRKITDTLKQLAEIGVAQATQVLREVTMPGNEARSITQFIQDLVEKDVQGAAECFRDVLNFWAEKQDREMLSTIYRKGQSSPKIRAIAIPFFGDLAKGGNADFARIYENLRKLEKGDASPSSPGK
jgi:hypothetical protein